MPSRLLSRSGLVSEAYERCMYTRDTDNQILHLLRATFIMLPPFLGQGDP